MKINVDPQTHPYTLEYYKNWCGFIITYKHYVSSEPIEIANTLPKSYYEWLDKQDIVADSIGNSISYKASSHRMAKNTAIIIIFEYPERIKIV